MKLNTPLVRNQTGIYCITNKLNGMKYIGRASCLLSRFSQHRGAYSTQPIARAIREQGAENFTFEVLEFCDYESTFERERYFIEQENSLYPNGYNAEIGDSLPAQNKSKLEAPEPSSQPQKLPYMPARKWK